jgi:hypothetical protein
MRQLVIPSTHSSILKFYFHCFDRRSSAGLYQEHDAGTPLIICGASALLVSFQPSTSKNHGDFLRNPI